MEFFGSWMVTAAGCGCCCLAVVVVVGIAGIMGMRRKAAVSDTVPGVAAAPVWGSATQARLTHMPDPGFDNETVQLKPRSRPAPAEPTGPTPVKAPAATIPIQVPAPSAKPPPVVAAQPPPVPVAKPPPVPAAIGGASPPPVPGATAPPRPAGPVSAAPPLPPGLSRTINPDAVPPGPRVMPAAPTMLPAEDDLPEPKKGDK